MVSASGPRDLVYPLRYAPPKALRWLILGVGAIMIAIASACVIVAFVSSDKGIALQVILGGLGPLVALFAFFSVRAVLRTALTLYADRLVSCRLLQDNHLLQNRDHRKKLSDVRSQYASSFKIVSRGERAVSINLYADRDDAFRSSFARYSGNPLLGSKGQRWIRGGNASMAVCARRTRPQPHPGEVRSQVYQLRGLRRRRRRYVLSKAVWPVDHCSVAHTRGSVRLDTDA